MIDSRDISDLTEKTQSLWWAFHAACAREGIAIIATCTYRDGEMQAELYSRGRTKPGRIVTNARPGESFHQYRVAIDFVPVVNGKAIWDDDHLWNTCGRIAESVGFEWSGRWRGSLRERAHVQQAGLSLSKLKSGFIPP